MEASFVVTRAITPEEQSNAADKSEYQIRVDIITGETPGQPKNCVLVCLRPNGQEFGHIGHAWIPVGLARAIASAIMGAAADARA